jgi:hypothetical protein
MVKWNSFSVWNNNQKSTTLEHNLHIFLWTQREMATSSYIHNKGGTPEFEQIIIRKIISSPLSQ